MSELGLSVRGQLFSGWQEVTVTRSLEQLAHTFSVSYTERSTEDGEPVPIYEGDAVTVKLDGEAVVTGWVDDADGGYDARSHRTAIAGRSLTCDLVDCSAVHKSGQWRDATILTIAGDLCRPYGLNVALVGSAGKAFRRFSLQESETVHEALERAARMRGFLLMTAADGSLSIARAGSRRVKTVIEYGVNVLTGDYHGSMRDRYSSYTMKTQAAGDDDFAGLGAATIKRVVTDARVKRHRPLIMMAENEDSGKELKERIEWEKNVRHGRGRRLTYQLQGWRDDDGELWEPNTLVRVVDRRFRVEDELLIVGVTLSRSADQGTTTVLTLTRKEAFDVQPFVPEKPKGAGGMGGLFDLFPGEGS